ncbi:uncharacterized protein LOC135955849 [Calliphora vicina]|uniref:uncharacterized protein LOC135955849 n=1 Tax=Calliphora vicina TaxID=7373 RepID=UPI00325A5B0B
MSRDFTSRKPRMSREYTPRKSRHCNKPISFREEQSPHNEELNFNTIWHTISQLEHYLREDHRQNYKLRMALDRQTERVLDLHACLRNEKQRNKRLVDLILTGDNWSSVEVQEEDEKVTSKFVNESYETISPLLMHQRYEELSCSYNVCRKQLLKLDKELKVYKCKSEIQQSKYENLLQEYKQAQKRLERIYSHCLRLEKSKNYKIHYLQEALTYATNSLLTAQLILDIFLTTPDQNLSLFRQDFQQNLQLFLNCLQLSEWNYCNCQLNTSRSN